HKKADGKILVEKKFYTKFTYTDNQATCKSEKMVTLAGSRLRPFYPIFQFMMKTFNFVVRFASQFSGGYLAWLPNIQFTQGFLFRTDYLKLSLIPAYTASFHEGTEVYPCSKQSYFYFSNKDGKTRPTSTHLVNLNRSERPCKGVAKCSVKMEASFVEGTNLVMVWINQDKDSENCYDDSQCAMDVPSDKIPFGFQEVSNNDTCQETERRKSKANDVCYSIDDDDSENERRPCSMSLSTFSIIPIFFGFFRFYMF
uniref:Uncharacterized protein n=1 Tax=Caenorhabditis japonica TaxID=281687 RepID=A0A8R1IVE2_CAEJA